MDSPLSYIGGKKPSFRKHYSKIDVLNDSDSDLISFYSVLQNDFEAGVQNKVFIKVNKVLIFAYFNPI